jgi:hypothetical protein
MASEAADREEAPPPSQREDRECVNVLPDQVNHTSQGGCGK